MQDSRLRRYTLLLLLFWTATILGLLLWTVNNNRRHTADLALHEARAFFQEIVTTRMWNAEHGGVYVFVTETTQPNPYLDLPDRDLTTREGLKLTLINPAFMTRQIGEIARSRNNVWFHITSLNPIRPENAPDEWETAALRRFEQGESQVFSFAAGQSGEEFFRYMAPLVTDEPCLKCHARQGYEEGDIRGGISVSMRADTFLSSAKSQTIHTVLAFGIVWVLGLSGLVYAARRLRHEESQKEEVIAELKSALERVRVLSGLVPICASCKKIRDDKGFWNKMEEYIQTHSDARFSHGICPECVARLYPEIANKESHTEKNHTGDDHAPTSSRRNLESRK